MTLSPPLEAPPFDLDAAFQRAEACWAAGDPLGAFGILNQAASAEGGGGGGRAQAMRRQALEKTLAVAAERIIGHRIEEGVSLLRALLKALGVACQEGAGRKAFVVEADLVLKRAASLAPDLAPIYQALGVLRFLVRQYPHAILYFQRCLARFDPSSAFHTNLGMSLKQSGRNAEAERAFLAALAVEPGCEPATAGVLYCREVEDPGFELDSILRRVGARADFFFVQIGAMDGVSFDPIHPHVQRWKWPGLVVEPNPESFAKLRRTYAGAPGIIFENAAVTETRGRARLRFVRDDTVHRHGLENTTLGMARIVDAATDAADPAPSSEFERFAETVEVDCLPLAALFDKHQITRVDLLQIDTEGYDWKILRQLDLARFRPSVINIEVIHVSVSERIELMTRLREHGYLYAIRGIDILAVRADVYSRL